MTHTPAKRYQPHGALVVISLLAVAALAGCVDDAFDAGDSGAPVAQLVATPNEAFAGEAITFDASGSHDTNGELTALAIDFGDGTSRDIDPDEADNITHTYPDAGEYDVTLTVTDDGKDQASTLSTSFNLTVYIHDAVPYQATVATASDPLNTTTNAAASQGFEVDEAADHIVVSGNLSSNLVAGSTEVHVSLLDASENVLAEDTLMVPAGEEVSILLESVTQGAGTYTLAFEANEGSATATGTIEVRYQPDGSGPGADDAVT